MTKRLSHKDAQIDSLVKHYRDNRDEVVFALGQIRGHIEEDRELRKFIHSVKWRVKDVEHLRGKLVRKWEECEKTGQPFRYTSENLFTEINDLAGIRILHLHTQQMEGLDLALKGRLDEARYKIVEGPIARTWDDETRAYFARIGIETKPSETLYTSVHYVIETFSKTKYTCEIQVRTLAEELWGETSHTINWPVETTSVSCREQLAVLAKVTAASTRLVDAIFRSYVDHAQSVTKLKRTRKSPPAKDDQDLPRMRGTPLTD